MGMRRSVLVAMVLVPLPACSEPFVAPTTSDECYGAGREQRGGHSADAASIWTMTYAEDDRSLGSTGTIYLCVPDDTPATVEVRVDGGVLGGSGRAAEVEGIVAEPATLVLTESGDRVPTVEVTVSGGTEHAVEVTYGMSGGGGGGTSSVDIEVDGDTWSFEGR